MPVVRLAPEMLWASIELMNRMALEHDVDSLARFFASFKFHDYSTLAIALKGAAEFGRSLAQTHNASKVCQGTARVVEDGDHPHFWTIRTAQHHLRLSTRSRDRMLLTTPKVALRLPPSIVFQTEKYLPARPLSTSQHSSTP